MPPHLPSLVGSLRAGIGTVKKRNPRTTPPAVYRASESGQNGLPLSRPSPGFCHCTEPDMVSGFFCEGVAYRRMLWMLCATPSRPQKTVHFNRLRRTGRLDSRPLGYIGKTVGTDDVRSRTNMAGGDAVLPDLRKLLFLYKKAFSVSIALSY